MANDVKPAVGTVVWTDLTVPDAESVKNFYCQVVGWKASPHNMGEYFDFDIQAPTNGQTVAGICHARGPNTNMPAQWIVYVVVKNAADSARKCEELGGKVVDGPRKMGSGDFCVVQDPAGAMLALIEG